MLDFYFHIKYYNTCVVRVAQLDRALGYGPRCRGFESSHVRKKYLRAICQQVLFYSAGKDPDNLYIFRIKMEFIPKIHGIDQDVLFKAYCRLPTALIKCLFFQSHLFFHSFLIARKLSSLITCSILQASSSAILSDTPREVRY